MTECKFCNCGKLECIKDNKGGAFVIGMFDINLNPILLDDETLDFLYKIVYGKEVIE